MIVIHALSGDQRVAAYLQSCGLFSAEGVGECQMTAFDGEPEECDEVIISAELADVDAICAAYKAKGVKVTVLGKQALVESE